MPAQQYFRFLFLTFYFKYLRQLTADRWPLEVLIWKFELQKVGKEIPKSGKKLHIRRGEFSHRQLQTKADAA